MGLFIKGGSRELGRIQNIMVKISYHEKGDLKSLFKFVFFCKYLLTKLFAVLLFWSIINITEFEHIFFPFVVRKYFVCILKEILKTKFQQDFSVAKNEKQDNLKNT